LCTGLWEVLKEQHLQQIDHRWLLVVGWIFFVLSIIAAGSLLALVPYALERFSVQDDTATRRKSGLAKAVFCLAISQVVLFLGGGGFILAFVVLSRLIPALWTP
jgi:hypothetical protein